MQKQTQFFDAAPKCFFDPVPMVVDFLQRGMRGRPVFWANRSLWLAGMAEFWASGKGSRAGLTEDMTLHGTSDPVIQDMARESCPRCIGNALMSNQAVEIHTANIDDTSVMAQLFGITGPRSDWFKFTKTSEGWKGEA